MGTRSALAALAATLAAAPLPAEEGVNRRYVPTVHSERTPEADEDYSQKAQDQTLFAKLLNLGDSINHSFFPENKVVGDIELFMLKLDKEMLRYGSDHTRHGLLHGDKLKYRHKGFTGFYREIGQAYRSLVEKSMIPLGGEAGPQIKEVLEKLDRGRERLEPNFPELRGFEQELTQRLAAIEQAQQQQRQQADGNPLQQQRLQPVLQTSQQVTALLEPLEQKIDQADQRVEAAAEGKDAAKGKLGQLQNEKDNIVDDENFQIKKAATLLTTGGTSGSYQSQSKPVLEMALERLREAVEKAEKGKEKTKDITDPDEQKGLLKKAHKALKQLADRERDYAQTGLEAVPRIEAAAANATDDALVSEARNQRRRLEDIFRNIESGQDAAREAIKKAETKWKETEMYALGKLEGGKSEIQGRLPYPFPMPILRAPAPKDTPNLTQTVSQNQKSKPIPPNFRQGLQMGTGDVMRQTGIVERGSNATCRPGDSC